MAELLMLTKKRVLAFVGFLSLIMFTTLILKSHWDYTTQLARQEEEIKSKVKKSSPCESYTEVSRCERCSKEELRTLVKHCMETGFKQRIRCSDGKESFLWCDISPAVEESDFWRFQAIVLTVGLISYAVVYLRQQKLDQKLMDKIHKQISAGV
ncbi:protein JTB [Aplysia californica]|uniref:Protein JTB n=1 Tax=Aplysia californica TaxID=6500 RepID=A0ABM0JDB7_APLCA|nr:protein JTB [Aplysia californica]